VGSAFVTTPELDLIVGTMITISVGLGISSGVSVYQAESLEKERELQSLEKAMLKNLDDSKIAKSVRKTTLITALINLSTPFLTCLLYAIPFVFALMGFIEIKTGAVLSIIIALLTLMLTGYIMSKDGKKNPIFVGLKMAFLGGVTFLIGYIIQSLL
jgi:predicted membrane protein (TIGR00267 family)